MSESYDLVLNGVNADTNTHILAQKLSKLLGINCTQIEMQLVKMKRSSCTPESLVSGLTKEKARRFQEALANVGLETTIKIGLSLVPIKKISKVKMFQCPSCGLKQKMDSKNEFLVCIQCGVVKEKYEEVQALKKYEKSVIEHNKRIEAEEEEHAKKKIKENSNKKWDKELKNKLASNSKKRKQKLLLSVLSSITVIAIIIYIYQIPDTNEKLKKTAKNISEKHLKKKQQPISIKMVMKEQKQLLPKEGSVFVVKGTGNLDSTNPIFVAKEADDLDAINNLLNKKELDLVDSDKVALEQISKIYEGIDENKDMESNYNSAKIIADTITNEEAKNTVKKHILWGEIQHGILNFDNLDIKPSLRPGENLRIVELTTKLIDAYIISKQFKKAVEESEQIKNPYLKAITLNKIIKPLINYDDIYAIKLNNKVHEIEEENKNILQKLLISATYAQGLSLLGDKKESEKILKEISTKAKEIPNSFNKIKTLLQLSEDQRIWLNLSAANSFTEDAHNALKKGNFSFNELAQLYSNLGIQYAKLFDFTRAYNISEKITDIEQKLTTIKEITKIEIKFKTNNQVTLDKVIEGDTKLKNKI